MRAATAVAKVPQVETPNQVDPKSGPALPAKKNSRLQRAWKFLQMLEQVVVGEILALTLSRSHLE